MKKKIIILCILGIFCCFSIAGCGGAENGSEEITVENTEEQALEAAEEPIEESAGEQIKDSAEEPESAADLSAKQIDAYEQMSLYIQEGFRVYGIEGAYQAYFGPIEEEEELFSCNILLEGTDGLWSEYISYTVDEENAWYTFNGQDERIFSGDSFWMLNEDSTYVGDLRENYKYKVQIAAKTDLPASVHYNSESGPIERDIWMEIPFRDMVSGYGYYVRPILYTYQDERLDIRITIEYPRISLSDDELEEKVNESLKNAFFYGYYGDDRLYPEKEVYSSICRTYSITREDERYFSVCMYEGNYARGANLRMNWRRGLLSISKREKCFI